MNVSMSTSPRTPARASCFILSFALIFVLGCSRDPYSCVRVSGKISYEDGSLIPADRISIVFYPQLKPIDPQTLPKAGRAEVDVKTGTFNIATTYRYNDGIIAGEQKVEIQCFGKDPASSKLVPSQYSNRATTPLTVQTNDSPFDFKIPKPGAT